MTTTPAIGASARRSRTVTRRDIELFTEISGDRNPIHYDDELAGRSRFRGLVVQGGVTSGLLNAVVAEQLPGPGSVFLEDGRQDEVVPRRALMAIVHAAPRDTRVRWYQAPHRLNSAAVSDQLAWLEQRLGAPG